MIDVFPGLKPRAESSSPSGTEEMFHQFCSLFRDDVQFLNIAIPCGVCLPRLFPSKQQPSRLTDRFGIPAAFWIRHFLYPPFIL